MSSFVSGSDQHEYLVISHLVAGPLGIYRSSILDISDPSFYSQYTSYYNGSAYLAADHGFSFSFDDYHFGAATTDLLGPINTWSTNSIAEYNLTFELSAPVILDGGSGVYFWRRCKIILHFQGIKSTNASTEQGPTNQWSMPAGHTSGTITRNGTVVHIDPAKSFTWYDRQFQFGSASNWTWFELHLNSSVGSTGEKLSVSFYPSGWGTERGFATVRNQPGINTVMPAYLKQGSNTWTSPKSNKTYPLSWTVELLDGSSLDITSVRADQELADAAGFFVTYEGFVEVSGCRANGEPLKGYGLVEVSPVLGTP